MHQIESVDLGQVSAGGQIEMTGIGLVKHFVQQAQLHAEFLHGGTHHDLVVAEHVIGPEEASEAIRTDLQCALDALEELE